MGEIIRFEGFSFQYNAQKQATLHDIGLVVRAGEKVMIVGPSGSGKSTIASCINGLVPFNYKGESTGSAQVGGKETKDLSLFALSRVVGTVLQDPDSQFIGLTAGEDIAFSLENNCVAQGEMLEMTKKAAALVGVGGFLAHSPYDLSGGQKQRVCMAGVIVDAVRLLLFDEPLANLDPATGKQAMELIDDIRKETDTTVLIIEHRLEDVLHRDIDRVVLVNDGRIVADMPPDDMMCDGCLHSTGLREPLYLTALKYAGVQVTPAMRPGRIATLALAERQKQQVRGWFANTNPPPLPPCGDELLRVEGLSFAYGAGTEVLRDVSFAVNRGEMAAIVGTNGAGKSTLAKVICGFEKTGAGRVLFKGEDMAKLSIAERAKHIGYVMQNPNQMLSKPMIFDEVAIGLRSRGMDEPQVKERVEETLQTCGLYPFRNWPISALSFGQKKRVTIASVLVMRPEIIILDEPTAGQDFRHYTEIMEFLRRLNEEGVTVLMITHDMHLMLEYAPRAVVFSEGRLLADSTAAKVLTNPALVQKASLKETSLYQLAQLCGIANTAAFAQHFIDYDREVRAHGN